MSEDVLGQSDINLTTFRKAEAYARKKRPSPPETSSQPQTPTIVPQEMYGYIFNLQSDVEQSGAMDYNKYARLMWEQFTGETEESKGFQVFEQSMIMGLHNIDMKDLVFPHLSGSLAGLIEQYKDREKLCLFGQ